MRKLTHFLPILFGLTVLLIAGGCKNRLALDAQGNPNTLVVGCYEGDNVAEVSSVLEKIRGYLEKKLDMKVEIYKSSDYTSVDEALLTKKVHMGYISPFSYVLLTQKMTLVPLVAPGINGKPRTYRSMIFTNPGTGIKTMDDVKARAKSLTLCFADPASTSGHLVPRAYLTSIGLDPKTAFKQTMFAGSHFASLLAVKGGKVDVGCSNELSLKKLFRQKLARPEELIALWQSDPIVESPIVMRPDINPQFAERVRQAYLNMPTDAPDVWKAYVTAYALGSSDSVRYTRVEDSCYNGLRKIAAGIDFILPLQK
jgi:phosphonate transport system substrate-binding protein